MTTIIELRVGAAGGELFAAESIVATFKLSDGRELSVPVERQADGSMACRLPADLLAGEPVRCDAAFILEPAARSPAYAETLLRREEAPPWLVEVDRWPAIDTRPYHDAYDLARQLQEVVELCAAQERARATREGGARRHRPRAPRVVSPPGAARSRGVDGTGPGFPLARRWI